MWANSVWGLLGFSGSSVYAMLGLAPDSAWQIPLRFLAVIFFLLSLAVLCWPMHRQEQRAIVWGKLQHPAKWMAELIEPSHVIILGLAIALGGVIWQWRNTPAPDPQIVQLRIEVDRLHKELAAGTAAVKPAPAAPKAVAYNERDIRELLDSLDEASTLMEKHILPTAAATNSMTANWFGAIPNAGAKTFVENLGKMKAAQKTEIWDPINELVYGKANRHPDEMRAAFVLDHEAARGELARSLQIAMDAVERLPENPSESTRGLIKPQFEEADRQAVIVWNWAIAARNRIASMKTNLKTQGVTGLEN
jgi:hypothetical protein